MYINGGNYEPHTNDSFFQGDQITRNQVRGDSLDNISPIG
jgi:hypothetical protein